MTNPTLRFAAGPLAGLFLATMTLNALAGDQKDPDDRLRLVRRVYVSKEMGFGVVSSSTSLATRSERMNDWLRQWLNHYGFIVAAVAKDADATLEGGIGDVIVLDGEQPNPPIMYYEYHLASPDHQLLWSTDFRIRNRKGDAREDERAARRIVERFVKAWLKSQPR